MARGFYLACGLSLTHLTFRRSGALTISTCLLHAAGQSFAAPQPEEYAEFAGHVCSLAMVRCGIQCAVFTPGVRW
jgi:hypothetical protein